MCRCVHRITPQPWVAITANRFESCKDCPPRVIDDVHEISLRSAVNSDCVGDSPTSRSRSCWRCRRNLFSCQAKKRCAWSLFCCVTMLATKTMSLPLDSLIPGNFSWPIRVGTMVTLNENKYVHMRVFGRVTCKSSDLWCGSRQELVASA